MPCIRPFPQHSNTDTDSQSMQMRMSSASGKCEATHRIHDTLPVYAASLTVVFQYSSVSWKCSVAAQPRGAPDWPPKNVASVLYQPFAITSFALALLMVFRTNSSYARWATAPGTGRRHAMPGRLNMLDIGHHMPNLHYKYYQYYNLEGR